MKRLLSIIGLSFCFQAIAIGAVINVPGDYTTIQAGINAANAGDIVLVADGTYTGPGNVALTFSGKEITVESVNGAPFSIVDCQNTARGFIFDSGETHDSVLSGFTIRNGFANQGGAIFIDAGTGPMITDCVLDSCEATDDGGGIYIDSYETTRLINCTITGCIAADDGGGIYGSQFAAVECLFDGNQSSSSGGGLYLLADNAVHSCLIANNSAEYGGGFVNHSTGSEMVNCLIVNNYAGQHAGGGRITYANNRVVNCTFTDNTAGFNYGGLHLINSGQIVTNCIFWNDTPNELYYNSGSGPDVTYSVVEGGWPGEGNLDTDPLFTNGLLSIYYLSHTATGQPEDSRCVNGGSDLASEICMETAYGTICLDQLTTRTDFQTDSGIVDIGYHTTQPLFATPTATPIPTSTPTGTPPTPTPTITATSTPEAQIINVPSMVGTIQEAINIARDGDTVLVADGVYTGYWNKMLDFHGKAITVVSENGAATTIIDCDYDGYGLIFQSGEGLNSIFSGFTIRHGLYQNGAGIRVINSAPLISHCIIDSCQAVEDGGGVFIDSVVIPEFSNCYVSNCIAGNDGGGLFGSSFKTVSCEFESNAAGHSGGGLLFYNDNSIYSCIIRNNTAIYGAGFYNYSTGTDMINCLITGNTASQTYGGGRIAYNNNEVINCTFTENTAAVNYGGLSFTGNGHIVTNCIFWNDTPNELHFNSGTGPIVSFCLIDGGWTGTGNIDSDPEFTVGYLGDYYLSEMASGQISDSPCLDSGNTAAATICHDALCMDSLTTRTDAIEDFGVVNIGYHYPAELPMPTETPTPTVTPTPIITSTPTPIPPVPSTSSWGIGLLLILFSCGIGGYRKIIVKG